MMPSMSVAVRPASAIAVSAAWSMSSTGVNGRPAHVVGLADADDRGLPSEIGTHAVVAHEERTLQDRNDPRESAKAVPAVHVRGSAEGRTTHSIGRRAGPW